LAQARGSSRGMAAAEPSTQTAAVPLKEPGVILKVTVEVTADHSETILVHEGDSAQSLAQEFCNRHGLPTSLVAPLAEHICDNMCRTGYEDDNHGRHKFPKALPPPPALVPEPLDTTLPGGSNTSAGASETTERPLSDEQALSTRQARTAPASANSHAGQVGVHRVLGNRGSNNGSTTSRFEWLHQDSRQRRFRLERLRQQVERDYEDRQVSSAPKVAPGSLRSVAWHRLPEDDSSCGNCNPGCRLHHDAARRQLKIKHLQTLEAQRRRQEEDRHATFRPEIQASQRTCQGMGRTLLESDNSSKKYVETLRERKAKAEMDACTFKPEIDQRSKILMEQRLARMQLTGTLYDALYEDALRRKERQFDAAQVLPEGVTFQPNIGTDHYRPPNDDNREDFLSRLAYSKSYSEKWQSVQRQQLQEQQQPQYDFHPKTGRGPLVERNVRRLPIGKFLYESAREKALSAERDFEASSPSDFTPRITEASRQLFEDTKRRKYHDIFTAMIAKDHRGQLRAGTLIFDGLEEELAELVGPIVAYLDETDSVLDFEAFCEALDHQRRRMMTPTAHLFTGNGRASVRCRSAQDSEGVNQPERQTGRVLARQRPRSAPLHEHLYRERDSRELRLQEKRALQEAQQLVECTFHPNIHRRSGSVGRPGGAGVARVRPESCSEERPWTPPPRRNTKHNSQPPLLPPELRTGSSTPSLMCGGSLRRSMTPSPDPAPRPKTGGAQEGGGFYDVKVNLLGSGEQTAQVSLLGSCEEQMAQANRAVAHCRTLLAATSGHG